MNDTELLKSLFEQLYTAYGRQLHAYLLGKTGCKETAGDLLQDVMLRIWNRMDDLYGMTPDRRRYWIFAVAANLVTDYYRHRAAQQRADTRLKQWAAARRPNPLDPETLAESKEQRENLENAIRELPEELRTILVMSTAGGMNSTQIGEALQMPAGTVRYKLSQARYILAAKMGLLEGKATEKGTDWCERSGKK
jgi:RNA polymerase sigma-70 factor (ECF subfamily)